MATGRQRLEALEAEVAVLREAYLALAKQVQKLQDADPDAWLDEEPDSEHAAPRPNEVATQGRAPQRSVLAAEPPVSMKVGGTTDEQKAAYKAWVEAHQKQDEAAAGYEWDGDALSLAPPTPQQSAMRAALAAQIGWENWTRDPRGGAVPLPEDEAIDAYKKGGPLWLYFYDRNFVLEQMPHVKQAMLQDAAITDARAGKELGSDIMKREDTGGTDVASDAFDGLKENLD